MESTLEGHCGGLAGGVGGRYVKYTAYMYEIAKE